MTDAAAALRVRLPTLSEVVNDLVTKRWLTRRYSVEDRRVVQLHPSRRRQVLTKQIEHHVRQVSGGGAARKVLTTIVAKQQ